MMFTHTILLYHYILLCRKVNYFLAFCLFCKYKRNNDKANISIAKICAMEQQIIKISKSG